MIIVLFSGLNNIAVYSVLSKEYSEYFGFTEAEMKPLLQQAGLADKAEEVKRWYNGYQVGDTTVYNPWSIANYIKKKGHPEPFWLNTSDNALIKQLLTRSDFEFKEQFETLLRGGSLEKVVDEPRSFA